MRALLRYLRGLASLKLAVFVILALSAAMTAGTIIESKYDTATAQYWVYRSDWFRGILGLLGINIFAVMISRWPWKKRHLPFLLAHIGILILLVGSWLTDKHGLDGMMRISEGDSTGVVELTEAYIAVTSEQGTKRLRVPWSPPGVRFKPIALDSIGVAADIDEFISRADAEVKFDAVEPARNSVGPDGAAEPWFVLKTQGGPLPFSQSFTLWAGDRMWSRVQAGPALLILVPKARAQADGLDSVPVGRPALEIQYDREGVVFRARNTAGQIRTGSIPSGKILGAVIDPGWSMKIQFVVAEYKPDARARIEYAPARVAFGPTAPTLSAVRVRLREGGQTAWIGLGDRTRLGKYDLGYFSSRVVLPFEIRLDRFQIDRYQGTLNPSEYSSQVTILEEGARQEPRSTVISMNEPLEHRGTTVYQASYEEGSPRPTVSVFSVNRDPGRFWKYLGSLLLVLGSILLFMAKRVKRASAGGR